VDGITAVSIRHLEQPQWRATVSEDGVYFQSDAPREELVEDTMRVQAELTTSAIERLGVQALNSLGTKFVAVASQEGPVSIVSQVQQLLGLDPARTLFQGSAVAATEVSVRIGYRLAFGSVSLEVSSDATSASAYVVGLDCYSWDTLALDQQHLAFMLSAYRHYADDVKAYLAPLRAIETAPKADETSN
jgi:hypothetical protein